MKRLGTISRGVAAAAALALVAAACGSDSNSSSDTTAAGAATTAAPSGSTATGSSEAPDVTTGVLKPVKLQLQWFTQAQFAGYFAALEKGFYRDEGLDVQILEGGVDIVPQTVLAQGNADFAIAWVPEGPAVARAGRRHHRHRADLPALRHPPGVEEAGDGRRPGGSSRARRSATGASATSSSCSRA